ncbi:MAG: RHS repeat-associated core domain-containing protein [Ferruginibacter sp.]
MNIRFKTGRIVLLILLVTSAFTATAQNVNKPNKMGPLGTQVNSFSGNLFIPRNDLFVSGRGFNLNISFYYNSYNSDQNVGFGNGWNMGYNMNCKDDTGNNKIIIWGDGRKDIYTLLGDGSYKSPRGFFSILTQYQPGKFLLTEIDGTKYYFDNSTHKKITKVDEPNGNFINFNYTDSLLTSIVNTAGQTISFTYDNAGRLSTAVDANGSPTRTYTYTYDINNNLIKVTDPLNNTNKYDYLLNGPMKLITDKNNNSVDIIYYNDFSVSELIGCNKRVGFSYDDVSNTTVITDFVSTGNQITNYKFQKFDDLVWLTSMTSNCCGFNMTFEFDNNGNKTKETDGNGHSTTYTYDSKGNMLTMTDALNQTMTYTYSSDYNAVTSFTDAKGNLSTVTYDSKGNMTQITDPGNIVYTATYNSKGDIVSSTDPKGNVYTYTYDAYGRPATASGPNGYNATMALDARGNLTSYTDAKGNSHTLEFDILNRIKKLTDPLNNTIQFAYDAEGNVTGVTNKNNEIVKMDYDASNRLVQYTDPISDKSFFSYDNMDNIVKLKNALGNSFTLTYDTRNRLSGSIDALGNTSSVSYDASGNVVALSLPNGNNVTYSYDAVDRLTAISDNSGPIVSVTFDKNGNRLTMTNGTGATTTATYDSLDRVKQVTDPLGNSHTLTYDKNGNVISVTDRNGFVHTYTYDGNDRIKSYTDNNGFVTAVGYDGQGNAVTLTDQNNQVTTRTFDNLNRLKSTIFPDGKTIVFTYDSKGNIVVKKLTDGTSINFTYDSLNRVVSKTLPGGLLTNYTYDAIGRVISATNNSGTVTVGYDVLNRIISETFDGRTTRYSYDIAGRKETTIYPDSTIVSKSFDTRNRLIGISKGNTVLVGYQYNNANQMIAKTFGNGLSTNMQYDFANRLSSYSTAGGSIQNTGYTYDKEKKVKSINRLNIPSLSEEFNYDNNYRLTNYKRGVIGGATSIQNSYTYDAVGNRTAANLNGTANSYTSNNLNQLLSNNNGSVNTVFQYDNNGNLSYDGHYYKTYDAEGRLIKDSASASNVLTYQYDGFGRRVQKTFNGAPLKYTYAKMEQIEERDGITNDLRTRTIFKDFRTPVVNEKNNNSYYYHQNEVGSIEAITNSAGNLTERYQYDAYGKQTIFNSSNVVIPSSIAGNRFGFTGQEFDSATNSNHFHYRNYSPDMGTFSQRDLTGYADGTGMYQYVHNDPANGIDVFGLQDCPPTTTQVILFWSEKLEGWVSLANTPGYLTWTMYEAEIKALRAKEAKLLAKSEKLLDLGKLDEAENLLAKSKYLDIEGKYANLESKLLNEAGEASKWAKFGKTVSGVSNGLTAIDVAFKTGAFINTVTDPNSGWAENDMAGGNLLQSAFGFTPIGTLYNGLDAVQAMATGGSMNEHAAEWGQNAGSNSVDQEQDEVEAQWHRERGDFEKWWKIRKHQDVKSFRRPKPNCPQNPPPSGTQDPKPKGPGTPGHTNVNQSKDPNEIVGTDGVPSKHWVSVNDRLPYTIYYENDKSASAPAKFVRITSPIEPKEDAASFQLGNFGFNTQTFMVPVGTSSYYNRLDCRDSIGLYVDITAGYDQIGGVAFWEFQSIDPVTLLPPTAPNKGFLLLQDTTQPLFGHAFVNFSMKPVSTAVTLDTIGARAKIVFDLNDTIPTNVFKNTIDAYPPVSHINQNIVFVDTTTVKISWNGHDDLNGVGILSYSLYVSVNARPFQLYKKDIADTSINFKVLRDTTYCFFISAFDSVKNMEPLKNTCELSVLVHNTGPLPLTWLYFNGAKKDKHVQLKWATGNEINTKNFVIERSFTGNNWAAIGTVTAAGNSNQQHDYTFIDSNALSLPANVLYYRLRQVDKDGKFAYSVVVTIRLEQTISDPIITAFPNPFSQTITLQVIPASAVDKTNSVDLYTIQGKLLYHKTIDRQGNTTTLLNDLPFLPSGVYILKTLVNETPYTFKISKQ